IFFLFFLEIIVMLNENESNQEKGELSELEWVDLRKDLATSQSYTETSSNKFVRKFKENPFVPIGCLTTAVILCFGLHSFKKGTTMRSQKLMRMRVLAQGFTVIAMLFGVFKATTIAKKK
ncbi:HIG1 domain family member 2A, mitochondrial, partial [Armadillidium nasatum]